MTNLVKSLIPSYKKRQLLSKLLITGSLIIISASVMIPFLWMISTSLKPSLDAVYVFPPEWIPKPPRFQNYIDAWNAAPFGTYLKNSLFVSFSAMVLQVINACLAAYVFSRINIPGRDILFLLFLAVLMIPGQVTLIPNYVVLSKLGWLNNYEALIIPKMATAFGAFLIRQAFLSVPDDLVDAAVIDGANHLQILWHVMIPLSVPMIITLALLTFNWRWNDYLWVLIMTNSDKMRTLPVGLALMRAGTEGGSKWHILMAATVIVISPIMILFAFAQRTFIEGISRTGIK